MKTIQEIQAVLDKVQPMVNQNSPQAECVWDTLRWVTGEDDEQDPYQLWVEDEEGDMHEPGPSAEGSFAADRERCPSGGDHR